MAIQSHTVQAKVNATSFTTVLTNTEAYNTMLIGQIDAINLDTSQNTITIGIMVGASAYILLSSIVGPNFSRLSDERKIPYELKPGESLVARVGSVLTNGFDIHVSYI